MNRAPVRSIASRIPRPLKNCRCGNSACDGGCGACSKPGLIDRLRSVGSRGCDDGCASPCANSGCGGCGDGGCGGGAVQYDMAPMDAPMDAPIMTVPESTEGSVIVPGAEGARLYNSVDPSSYVIKKS